MKKGQGVFYFVIYLIIISLHSYEESYAYSLFEKVSTSRAVYTINKFVYVFEEMMSSFSHKPVANPILKDLAREAMVKMGLPTERHVPVCAMHIANGGDGIYAQAIDRFILVNENLMNKRSYGVCRFILFHEVAHLKYHSGLTNPLLGSIVLAAFIATLASSMINDDLELGQLSIYQMAIALPLSYAFLKLFSFLAEKHADKKAIQYGQCTICVAEYLPYAPTFSWTGDLSRNECIEWDKKYNSSGTLCEYHLIQQRLRRKF